MSERDDELTIDVNLRSPFEVGARMLIVAALVRVALAESEIDEEIDADQEASEVIDLRDSLEYGPWSGHITPDEREFLRRSGSELAEEDLLGMMWRIEALSALRWATFGLGQLPEPWRPADPTTLAASIPAPWDEVDDYFNSIRLRDEEAIAMERERAELWAWRAAIEEDFARGSKRETAELKATLRDVASEASAAGLLSAIDRDFAVDNRSFASIDPEAKALITEISLQRLHAFNWLCGFGTTWEDVPLDL